MVDLIGVDSWRQQVPVGTFGSTLSAAQSIGAATLQCLKGHSREQIGSCREGAVASRSANVLAAQAFTVVVGWAG